MKDSTSSPGLTGRGTPEERWAAADRLAALPDLRLHAPRSGRVVVVAPHPDDEVLGAGGAMALLVAEGCRLALVAVTDGEMSDPAQREALRVLRPREAAEAAATLGVDYESIHRLCQSDSEVDGELLDRQLAPVVGDGDLVLGPWWRDGHPDHDVVGRCCRRVADRVRATMLAYLVWTWHWCSPESDDIPWEAAGRVELPADVRRRKAAAVRCFRSQIEGDEPILPGHVLERLTRSFEVLLRA
ncbi:MAG: PIG-L deacetylase family protein [Acidimicrobiales bacterium]